MQTHSFICPGLDTSVRFMLPLPCNGGDWNFICGAHGDETDILKIPQQHVPVTVDNLYSLLSTGFTGTISS